jgi:hypothetical protein
MALIGHSWVVRSPSPSNSALEFIQAFQCFQITIESHATLSLGSEIPFSNILKKTFLVFDFCFDLRNLRPTFGSTTFS